MSKKKKETESVRLVIAGSRTIKDYDVVKKAIEKGLKTLKLSVSNISEVVSGHANGADKFGEKWAMENKIKVKIFLPEWDNIERAGAVVATNAYGKKYDKMAGFLRNEQMADYGDALICVNEGTNGSDHMYKTMTGLKKPAFEEKLNQNDENFTHSF